MAVFRCDRCAACCRTFPIFATHEDARREPRIADEAFLLPEHLQTPEWAYKLFHLPFHETCCFLGEDNLCRIHPTRPDVCREFAPGDDQCQEARERDGLPPLDPVREDQGARDR